MTQPLASERDEVLGAVREDPALTPAEKETNVHFAKDEDRATVFTSEAGLTRRLLSHPEFEVDHLVRMDGEPAGSVDSLDTAEDAIVGVKGSVPVACLKMQASRRSERGHAAVVTHRTNSAFKEGDG